MEQSVLHTRPNSHVQTIVCGAKLQGRYLIVKKLGAGGMGAVYEAVDERLQVTVAIKQTFAVEPRMRRQFEQEARLLAQLTHPALPRVSDYFTENDGLFLVMQFIAGDDLAHVIAERPGPFPRAQVIAWADQLLDALIYLHTRERQIIHRDIKPHNLKLAANGQIALLDFGLAKAHASDQTTTASSHSIFGYTRRYSPLEQIQDQGTSPQSDIYALGATLYHLLTGIKPPDALVRAAALASSKIDPLMRACEVHPLVGPELSAILGKALALNSSGRFQTAQEFREALRVLGRNGLRGGDSFAEFNEMAARSTTSSSDPFDGYSILKPQDVLWATPKRSWSIPAMICGIGIIGVLAFIGSTFVASAPEVERAVTDAVKATAARNPGPNPTRESRTERQRVPASESPALVASHEVSSSSEKQKRSNKRPVTTPGEPHAPSVAPALRLPAQ
jgi:serine/threonine protein kinase